MTFVTKFGIFYEFGDLWQNICVKSSRGSSRLISVRPLADDFSETRYYLSLYAATETKYRLFGVPLEQ